MQDRRTRFFWSVAIGIGMLMLIWELVTLLNINGDLDRYAEAAQRTVIGTDQELTAVIEDLETNLQARSEFKFDLRSNPMKLDKVIFLTDDMGRLIQNMQANTIRVSGLYMNFDPPRATVEYLQKEHTLKVGESVAGEKIVKITRDGIVTYKEGKRRFRPLQGRTIDPSKAGLLTREEPIDQGDEY